MSTEISGREKQGFTSEKLASPLAGRISSKTFPKSPPAFPQLVKKCPVFFFFQQAGSVQFVFRGFQGKPENKIPAIKLKIRKFGAVRNSEPVQMSATLLEEFSLCHQEMCTINPKVLILFSCLFETKVPLGVSAGSGEMCSGLSRVLCAEGLWNSCSRLCPDVPLPVRLSALNTFGL